MTHYPAPRINQALGLESAASLDDALAAIAQLRASVIDTETLRAERDEARQSATAGAERDAAEYHTLRREFERARDDAADLRATLANTDRFAQRMQRERDAAYAVIHHLTGEFAP